MNKFMKRIRILFFICLVIGGGLTIAGLAMGGTLEHASVSITDKMISGIKSRYKGRQVSLDTEDLNQVFAVQEADVKELKLKLKNCNLQILSSTDGQIRLETDDAENDILAELEDGKLTIKDTRKHVAGLTAIDVYLYLPETKVFKKVSLDLGVGTTEIETLSAKKLSVDAGTGTLGIARLTVTEKLDADLGVGDVTIGLVGEETDYNYDISCGVGELELFGTNCGGLGKDQKIDNGADCTISLDCGVGSVSIQKAE
jgi:hypothetical protein